MIVSSIALGVWALIARHGSIGPSEIYEIGKALRPRRPRHRGLLIKAIHKTRVRIACNSAPRLGMG